MKIATILGRRSEIIRLSQVIKVLDQHCEHVLIHTGEESDESLCGIHLNALELRAPDIDLRGGGDLEVAIEDTSPERILAACPVPKTSSTTFYFGSDTDFSFADVALFCTTSARERALRNGIDPQKALVVGDPTKEVLDTFADSIEATEILTALGVRPFDYFLATVHQKENISDELSQVMDSLAAVAAKFGKTVLFPVHPATAKQLETFQIKPTSQVRLLRALSFFEFVKLEKNALAVLTDSSGVQDECCVLGAPVVTLADRTMSFETVACGSNIVAGRKPEAVTRAVELAIGQPAFWEVPGDYRTPNVSQIVARIVLSEAFAQ